MCVTLAVVLGGSRLIKENEVEEPTRDRERERKNSTVEKLASCFHNAGFSS